MTTFKIQGHSMTICYISGSVFYLPSSYYCCILDCFIVVYCLTKNIRHTSSHGRETAVLTPFLIKRKDMGWTEPMQWRRPLPRSRAAASSPRSRVRSILHVFDQEQWLLCCAHCSFYLFKYFSDVPVQWSYSDSWIHIIKRLCFVKYWRNKTKLRISSKFVRTLA